MKTKQQCQGALSEQQACEFLENNGLKLITRNFHCCFGEIDLIMKDHDTLVFVEVRFRKSNSHGDAMATITKAKQSKLIKTAHYFLNKHQQWQNFAYRFDAVASSDKQTTWLKSAFDGV